MWKRKYQDLMFPVDSEHVGMHGFYLQKSTGSGIPGPDENMLKKAEDLKLKNLPKHLYKYRQFDANGYALDNLSNDSIWLSEPKKFNDPFDSRIHSYYLDFIEIQINFVRRFEKYKESKCALFKMESESGEVLIRSFTKSLGNHKAIQGMAHYFQEIKDAEESIDLIEKEYGEAFEYILFNITKNDWDRHKTIVGVMDDNSDKINDISHDANRISTKICCLSEVKDSNLMWSHYADSHRGFCVEYDISRLALDSEPVSDFYPVIYHDIKEHEPEDRLKGIRYYHLYSILRKSSEWEYEKEWRFVYAKGDSENSILTIPVVSAVYLGCEVEDVHKKEVLEIAKKKNIKVFLARKKGRLLKYDELSVV